MCQASARHYGYLGAWDTVLAREGVKDGEKTPMHELTRGSLHLPDDSSGSEFVCDTETHKNDWSAVWSRTVGGRLVRAVRGGTFGSESQIFPPNFLSKAVRLLDTRDCVVTCLL